MTRRRRTLLVLSQVYVPDPASVGQHMADAAVGMVRRGYRVVVLTANRGYNDPTVKYPARETIDGVEVHRLPLSSFGKGSIFIRLLGGCSFLFQCIVRCLLTRRLAGMLVSTSPPMCSAAALIVCVVRRVPFAYWAMDINPDQMVAMGWTSESSLLVKVFHWFNRQVLGRAGRVVTLDRFMADRLRVKVDLEDKLVVMAPWPHEDHLQMVRHAENPFRKAQGLDGKFVIMYSGNHSTCSPLRTILDAAVIMRDEPNLVFMFIGDGTGKREVDETIAQESTSNIISLPYQPLSQIKYSLSAADVHLVVVGDRELGVRHPCKVYGAMALARPILLLGPDPCHASELVTANRIGWHIQHGDVDGAVCTIRHMLKMDDRELARMGKTARHTIQNEFSQSKLCPRFCEVVDAAIGGGT